MYRDWRWAAPEELREAAERGSLCTRLYLEWVEGAGVTLDPVPSRELVGNWNLSD